MCQFEQEREAKCTIIKFKKLSLDYSCGKEGAGREGLSSCLFYTYSQIYFSKLCWPFSRNTDQLAFCLVCQFCLVLFFVVVVVVEGGG